MPLDDHEQRILAEIERHLYEDDPDLANAVKKIDRNRRLGLRLPVVGLAIGAVIILVSFTSNTLVALAGFALMVVSATGLVHALRSRVDGEASISGEDLLDRLRNLRRYRRG